jgi:hypothetical protein
VRLSSLVLVTTFVTTILLGTASAGPPPPPPHKRPGVATALGISFTLLTVPLVLLPEPGNAGWGPAAYVGPAILMSIAPAIGRMYAGEIGGMHLAVRGVGIVAMIAGGKMAGRSGEDTPRDPATADIGLTLAFLGATVVVGDVIVDLATTGDAARRFNKRHAVDIAPAAVTPSGALAPGLSLSGRF